MVSTRKWFRRQTCDESRPQLRFGQASDQAIRKPSRRHRKPSMQTSTAGIRCEAEPGLTGATTTTAATPSLPANPRPADLAVQVSDNVQQWGHERV